MILKLKNVMYQHTKGQGDTGFDVYPKFHTFFYVKT